MKKLDIALRLIAYDTYCNVCAVLEVKPVSFGDYAKRVFEEVNKNE